MIYLVKMFLEPIQCHLAVCARADLPRMARLDPNFWNVISLRGPTQSAIERRGFKKIHQVVCLDAAGADPTDPDNTLGVPRKEHVQGIFAFADSLPGEPLLVHCMAGVSRSAAVAFALIVRGLHVSGISETEIVEQAPQMLLEIRPQAAPNPLILELGLAEFMQTVEAKRLTQSLLEAPAFSVNRRRLG